MKRNITINSLHKQCQENRHLIEDQQKQLQKLKTNVLAAILGIIFGFLILSLPLFF